MSRTGTLTGHPPFSPPAAPLDRERLPSSTDVDVLLRVDPGQLCAHHVLSLIDEVFDAYQLAPR